LDVAFDLALYEVVEEARNACRATGAAIALERDGEMICRATIGANAPDLGVPVEMSSGLAAECLNSAHVQHCDDTETDARVDAAACRRQGVRSMLMVPVVEQGRVLGILELFSDQPNAFAVSDLATLLSLSERIVEHKREVELGQATITAEPQTAVEAAAEFPNEYAPQDSEEAILPAESESSATSSAWTAILGLLVIAAAIALGVALGWRGAARAVRTAVASRASESPAASANSVKEPETSASNPPVAAQVDSTSPVKTSSPSNREVPSGGLVITQDGKVIYRMEPARGVAPSSGHATASVPASSTPSRLIHRVEPEYPLEAREKHIQGSVVLDVQVQGEGTVGNIDVVQGDPLLSEAAIQAVRQWKYQPYLVDGRPVESQTRITINFTLPEN